MKIATCYRGGLGDILERLLEPGQDAGFWRDLASDGHEIHVIVVGINPQSVEIFETNPHVAQVHYVPYKDDFQAVWRETMEANGLVRAKGVIDPAQHRWSRPTVFLTDAEMKQVEGLPENYVAIHPFAGEVWRNWYGLVSTEDVIDWCVQDRREVVLLGGNSLRKDPQRDKHLEESCHYQRHGLLNWVGKASLRCQVYAAMDASSYIGTNSCYASVAHVCKIPSLLITSSRLRLAFAFGTFSIHRNLRANNTQYLFFDELHHINLQDFVSHFLVGDREWDFEGAADRYDRY